MPGAVARSQPGAVPNERWGGLAAMTISWETDWDAAFARAQAERKPLLIDIEREN